MARTENADCRIVSATHIRQWPASNGAASRIMRSICNCLCPVLWALLIKDFKPCLKTLQTLPQDATAGRSGLGNAIHYTLNHWDDPTRYR